MGGYAFDLGVTRLGGFAVTGAAIANLMLANYGVRGTLMSAKLWRPALFGLALLLVLMGGFRSSIIAIIMVFGLLFWLEGLHRSRLILPFGMAAVLMGAVLVPTISYMPYTVQRCFAFLPLDIDPVTRMNAEDSSQWRLDMWAALLPQIPNYLLLGKGLAIKVETFNEVMGQGSAFARNIDASQNPLALANDFHSGPLSIVIPFGIWGVLAWLWFWGGGFYVLYRNYKYCDPDLKVFSRFLLATFVGSCIGFIFVFGDMGYITFFCGTIGLSVALNHGVCGPAKNKLPAVTKVFGPPLASRPQPALQR
jgi:hypothetical protein